MIEIRGGCWLAKDALWRFGGREIALPNIAYFSSKISPPPEWAEATCGPAGLLSSEGSAISPKTGSALPPLAPEPLLLESSVEPSARDGICILQGRSWMEGRLPDAELYVLANSAELWRRPREMALRLARFSDAAPGESALYLPGCATPANLALLFYCGAGLVDDIAVRVAASCGIEMGHDGSAPSEKGAEDTLSHNLSELRSEMRRARRYLSGGRLREYVEYKAGADPLSTALLRHMDMRHYETVERRVPVDGPRFVANSRASLSRPDVARWHRRILERYRPPEGRDILLLLPCSARKPYSSSKTHALFIGAVARSGASRRVHHVIVTSPLGAVPRELESLYPARHYDIPVTGDWDREERHVVSSLVAHLLGAGRYTHVVAHIGIEFEFLKSALGDAAWTAGDAPTSAASLSSLEAALRDASDSPAKQRGGGSNAADLASVARFQFGDAGTEMMEGAMVRKGRGHLQVFKGTEQIASYREERGMLSLAPVGGKILAERGAYVVKIDDFSPKGSVFVSGVLDADAQIRAGDDVVVAHEREVRAVGVASMGGPEMLLRKKGEAVKTRR